MSHRSRRSRMVLLGIALGLCCGCQVDDRGDDDWTQGREARPGTPAEWAVIAEAQARRLETLSIFSGNGSLVIDSKDEQGKTTTDRLNHRLWRVAPDKAALRLSVSGITLGRLGWNGNQWWWLNEGPDRPELTVVDMTAPQGPLPMEEETLSPPVVLFLIGLMPFPSEAPSDFMIAGDRARFSLDSIRWSSVGGDVVAGTRHAIVVGAPADGPIGIEVFDGAGMPSGLVALSRFEPVETLGKPPGAWPNLANRIVLSSTHDVLDRVVITFDGPLAQGRISERLFDLDALVERVDPVLVEGRNLTSQRLLESKDAP